MFSQTYTEHDLSCYGYETAIFSHAVFKCKVCVLLMHFLCAIFLMHFLFLLMLMLEDFFFMLCVLVK